MGERPALGALAERLGIAPGYHSAVDGAWHATSDATRERLVAAMGFEVDSETRTQALLDALEAEARRRWLSACRVVPDDVLARTGLALERAVKTPIAYAVRLTTEQGGVHEWEGALEAGGSTIGIAASLPWGEHHVRLELRGPGAGVFEQRLLVTPRAAHPVDAALPEGGGFGLTTQLYALRRREGWGAGDLGELRALIEGAGAAGAAFVALNPLHVLANEGDRVAPYSPLSRLFRNPVYIELEQVPEWDDEAVRRLASTSRVQQERARLVGASRIELESVARLKQPLLEALYAAFLRRELRTGTARGRAYRAYRDREGDALEGYGRYRAIVERLSSERNEVAGDAWDWRRWPAALREAGSDAVECLAREQALRVDFHAWCQFELDRQLGDVAAEARARGLGIGLLTDVALGAARGGCDDWLYPEQFASASVGAPPDAFARGGQSWGLPPLDPTRLRADGYRLWRRILRASLAHAGAMRLDHALALRRLFWIPDGRGPEDGAYVAYPEAELLGVLALESHRARAAIVAEDLGTVPEGFRDTLRERGVLTSSVLLFEREGDAFRAPEHYPVSTLASASTHDLPPLAAWLGSDDLALRRRAGQIASDAELVIFEEERARLQGALADLVAGEDPGREAHGAPGGVAGLTLESVGVAVTRFLCRTPARLVALSVEDLAGEAEPVNLPGVPLDRHRSWCRPVQPTPEALFATPLARAQLEAVPEARRSRPRPGPASRPQQAS